MAASGGDAPMPDAPGAAETFGPPAGAAGLDPAVASLLGRSLPAELRRELAIFAVGGSPPLREQSGPGPTSAPRVSGSPSVAGQSGAGPTSASRVSTGAGVGKPAKPAKSARRRKSTAPAGGPAPASSAVAMAQAVQDLMDDDEPPPVRPRGFGSARMTVGVSRETPPQIVHTAPTPVLAAAPPPRGSRRSGAARPSLPAASSASVPGAVPAHAPGAVAALPPGTPERDEDVEALPNRRGFALEPGSSPCLVCMKVIAQDPTKECTYPNRYQSCDTCRVKRLGYCQPVRISIVSDHCRA